MLHARSRNSSPQPRHRRGLARSSAVAGAAVAVAATVSLGVGLGSAATQSSHDKGGFNDRGNWIIADQFNNRVVETNPAHQVVWSFGDGSSVAGPNSVVGPNDAERVGNFTLISGTGTPPSADPSCTNPSGCADNRVMMVDRHGHIVWQYGQAGVGGAGFDQLNTPVAAILLPDHNILITDQVNERVIEVTFHKHIVWQYGMTGVSGSAFNQLNNPNSAELLRNGDILIADENNNRVIEVNRHHHIVWQYGSPSDTTTINGAAFASRLWNGDTLITDTNNNRVIEVTDDKQVVFTYNTSTRPGSIAAPLPTRAVRLHNGDILISDQYNDQVIEINPHGQIVTAQGQIQNDSTGFNGLNAPYAAYRIGDFTGLTSPFDFFSSKR